MTKSVWRPLMCAAALAAACQSKPAQEAEPVQDGHGHAHKAPRGGRLVELGKEFAHLEVLYDRVTATLTVHVLDGGAGKAVRVPEEALVVTLPGGKRLRLPAVESPLTGEKAGDASEFSVTADVLRDGLDLDDAELEAITVRGLGFRDVALKGHREAMEHVHAH